MFRWPGRGESGQPFPNQFPKLLPKLATSDMELQGAGVANILDLLHLILQRWLLKDVTYTLSFSHREWKGRNSFGTSTTAKARLKRARLG